MGGSIFIKTEGAFGKFCFWLSISNFWQKQKKRFKTMLDLEPVKSVSAVLSV